VLRTHRFESFTQHFFFQKKARNHTRVLATRGPNSAPLLWRSALFLRNMASGDVVVVRVTNGPGHVTATLRSPGQQREFELDTRTALQCATLAVHLTGRQDEEREGAEATEGTDELADFAAYGDFADSALDLATGGFAFDLVQDTVQDAVQDTAQDLVQGAVKGHHLAAWDDVRVVDAPMARSPVRTVITLHELDLGAAEKVFEFARHHAVVPFRPVTQWPVTTANFESLFADEFDRGFFTDARVGKTTTLAAIIHVAELLGVADLCHLTAVKLATDVRGGRICDVLHIDKAPPTPAEQALAAAEYPHLAQ
jgi:hypothetical protein